MKYDSTTTARTTKVPHQSYKDANVKESRLNAGGDKQWRGKRGGGKMGKKSY